jgi:hypothetical protein
MKWKSIWEEVKKRLNNITDDETDEENLHRVKDAKTIELLEHYRELGNIMSKEGTWETKDYSDRVKHIDAIMDFDCGGDANCEQYKRFFIDKSTIVHRPPQQSNGSNVIVAQNVMTPMKPMQWHGNPGHGGRRRPKHSKKHSKKSRKSKSRRHSNKSRRH